MPIVSNQFSQFSGWKKWELPRSGDVPAITCLCAFSLISIWRLEKLSSMLAIYFIWAGRFIIIRYLPSICRCILILLIAFFAFQMSLCQLTKVCCVAQSLWRNSICRSAERNCQQTDWGVKIQLFYWLPKIKLFGWHNIETMCHWNSMRPPYYTDLIPYFFFLLSHINLNI